MEIDKENSEESKDPSSSKTIQRSRIHPIRKFGKDGEIPKQENPKAYRTKV